MAIAELVMPKLGESIMEATILKWSKKVGDFVKLDETVLDIATDKVDSEVPSTAEGILIEILFNVNDVVPIGTVIARIKTDAATGVEEVPAAVPFVAEPSPIIETVTTTQEVTVPEPVFIPAPEPEAVIEETEPVAAPPIEEHTPAEIPYLPAAASIQLLDKPAANRFYSPLVLNIANSENIALSELERIPGTGNDGRVSKKDILQYVADKKAGVVPAYTTPTQTPLTPTAIPEVVTVSPEIPASVPVSVHVTHPISVAEVPSVAAPAPSYSGKLADPAAVVLEGHTEIMEMDRMRKLIAKHMVDSKHTSPHVTSFAEADVTNMVLWREKVKHDFEKREGTKITFTPLFIDCLTTVMKRFPLINCSLDGDRIIIKKDLNIGMATALPSGNLIVPVIKGADQLNLVGLSKAVNQLADAARNNKLKPDDTAGGTFTLTNVGTFGSLMGTPIINQPQVAILAVGAIKKRPMVIETPAGDTIGIRHMMYLSLSYDHRIVDGSIGAGFLSEVAKEFEKWDINRQWYHYL